MYVPAGFREDDPAVLHELMRRYSFGMLISVHNDEPFITHVPFLLDAERGPLGSLSTHLARANPHWEILSPGREVLVVFQGPHAYISSAHYKDQPAAPTWNYAVVHAYGIPRFLKGNELTASLHAMTAAFEPHPEDLDMPELFVNERMESLVGVEIALTRLAGKFKLSQNRPGERSRLADEFVKSSDPAVRDLADLMRPRSEAE